MQYKDFQNDVKRRVGFFSDFAVEGKNGAPLNKKTLKERAPVEMDYFKAA